MTHSQRHYDAALRKILSDEMLRIFLWRLIEEDCRVFQEGFPTNASAYCLLARQEIGKRLLADAKMRDPEAVFKAEQEYKALMALDRATEDLEDIYIEEQGE